MTSTPKEGSHQRSHKSTPQQQETVKVAFPCVHGAATGQLVVISCFQADELKGTIKVVAGVDEQSAQRIIGAARYAEKDDRAATGVITFFSNPLFGGESYGLALSLADKMTRLGNDENWTEIYATGSIPPDGCGVVRAIRGLREKVDLVSRQGKPGSLFVFPADNLSDSSEEIQEKLTQLEAKGIQYRTVRHINDLEGVLWGTALKEQGCIKIFNKKTQLWKKIKSRIPQKILLNNLKAGVFLGLIGLLFIGYLFWIWHEQKTTSKQNTNENVVVSAELEKNTKTALESGNIDVKAY